MTAKEFSFNKLSQFIEESKAKKPKVKAKKIPWDPNAFDEGVKYATKHSDDEVMDEVEDN